MVISASIVILYSAFGGIQSVTITDILQCATFTIMIPYVAYKVFHHTGMTIPQILKAASQTGKFQFDLIYRDKTKMLSLIAGWLAYIRVSPAAIQRIYMAKNSRQAREVYFASTTLVTTINLIVIFTGIAVCVGYSNLTSPGMIWPTIVSDSSAIFKGFFVISLFAMSMSTADSCLNVASSMLAYDVVSPLRKNKLTDEQQLCLAKMTCFIIGILAIILALYTSKYSESPYLRLLFLTMNISNPIFVAPLLLAVFGFRCEEKIAVLGMMVGIITLTLWKEFIPDIDSSFVAMLANGITMLLAHYSLPKKYRQGWANPGL